MLQNGLVVELTQDSTLSCTSQRINER